MVASFEMKTRVFGGAEHEMFFFDPGLLHAASVQ